MFIGNIKSDNEYVHACDICKQPFLRTKNHHQIWLRRQTSKSFCSKECRAFFLHREHLRREQPIHVVLSNNCKQTFIPLKGKLGEGKFAIIDYEDTTKAKDYSWSLTANGYARGVKDEKDVYMAKLILKSTITDHINGDRLDNRKCNLRPATDSQNTMNRTKSKFTKNKYKGVQCAGNKWRAYIGFNKKQYHIGMFESETEAVIAYNNKARELFGEYAKLNVLNKIEGNTNAGKSL